MAGPTCRWSCLFPHVVTALALLRQLTPASRRPVQRRRVAGKHTSNHPFISQTHRTRVPRMHRLYCVSFLSAQRHADHRSFFAYRSVVFRAVISRARLNYYLRAIRHQRRRLRVSVPPLLCRATTLPPHLAQLVLSVRRRRRRQDCYRHRRVRRC